MTSVERAFPALVQEFFHRRLIAQRGASPHAIASYRDTFTLFLGYAAERTGRTPSALALSDLDAPMVLGFLDHLETERGNSARTRNLRLTAIRSFMRYASLREPSLLPVAQRVLAIPVKRFDRPVLGYLSRDETTAIIDAPDRSTWSGQRDAVLFAVLYNTGARVSEITRLHVADVLLDRASSLLLHGKGRKERVVPLWKTGVDITVIALWLGHENTTTTHQYVEADLAMKEAALRCVDDPAPQPLRFTATDRLLDFLEGL